VSRRTLFRDLAALRDAGVDYFHDPELGYRLASSSRLPPIELSVREALGLMMLSQRASVDRGQPLMEDSLTAIRKLVSTIREPILSACRDLLSRVTIDPGDRPAMAPEVGHFTIIQRCVDEGRACRFRYVSPEEGEFEGSLHPYALHFAIRSWYVLGWTDRHDEVRVLKLERFRHLAATEHRFVAPKDFSVQSVLGKAWRLIPGDRVYEIDLMFSSKVGRNVAEVLWHNSQRSELLEDGRCRARFTVQGLNEIAWWICGYANEVEVLRPKQLRELVAGMHAAAAKLNAPL